MIDGLKSCPFCGGDADYCCNYSYKTHVYFVMVKCTVCGSQGKVYSVNEDPEDEDWQNDACIAAAKLWNRRIIAVQHEDGQVT